MRRGSYIKLFENWINEAEATGENIKTLLGKIAPLIRASAKDKAVLDLEFGKKLKPIDNDAEKESIERQLNSEKEFISRPWKDVIMKETSLSTTQAEKIRKWASSIEDALYTKQMSMMKTQFESAGLDVKNWENLYNLIDAQKAMNIHNDLLSKELSIEKPTIITQ